MTNLGRWTVCAALGSVVLLGVAACNGPRMNIVTTTTLGLHATPGDGSTQPPQVSLAYKRAEVAVIPAGKGGADDPGTARDDAALADGDTTAPPCAPRGNDLFSALTAFGFQTRWFGKTALDSVIATGHAARRIACAPGDGTRARSTTPPSEFANALKAATR